MELDWTTWVDPQTPSVRVKDDDVEVFVHYDLGPQGVVITGVSGDDLTATVLRKLRIGELRKLIHRHLAQVTEQLLTEVDRIEKTIEQGHPPAKKEEARQSARNARRIITEHREYLRTTRPQRGRAADNQEWYGYVARVYLDFYAQHGQRAVKAMAEYLDEKPNTVYWWVRRAREERWLTKGQQGRAGAKAGSRLITWLKEQEEEQ
jgi:hypothetical protein